MFSFIFSALCSWFAFFLPCFATYKTLSQRPIVEADVERWCFYWSVIGALVGAEYLAGWLVSWLPFYWEIKTVFLLFLALPQVQGSTFIYKSYLQPFFAKHEHEIDSGIVSIQSNVLSFAQTRLAALWELLWSVLNKAPATGQPPSQTAGQQQQSAAPVSLDAALGLFKSYAPGLLNALKPADAPAASASSTPNMTPRGSSTSVPTMSAQSRTPQNEQPPPFPEPVHM